jgi:hypothetical protein
MRCGVCDVDVLCVCRAEIRVGADLRTAHTITQVIECVSESEKRGKLNKLLERVTGERG